MKVLEVNTLQTGMDTVEKDLDVQKQQLQQIEQSIQAFVDLRDSFKGLGGQSKIFQGIKKKLVSHRQLLSQIGIMEECTKQLKRSIENGYGREQVDL